MKVQIENLIQDYIFQNYNLNKKVQLTIPPQKSMGDFATNIALSISKELKKNPAEVAEGIQKFLLSKKYQAEIAGPGFINIVIDQKILVTDVINSIQNSSKIGIKKGENIKISIEHTAANPNKHLHVGHLRNFAIGDSLVKVMKLCNYDVSVQLSLQDQGLQVAKVVWGFLNLDRLGLEEFKKYTQDFSLAEKFDFIAGKVYVAAEKEISQNPELELEVREIIQKMEAGGNEIASFGEKITRQILMGHFRTLEQFGVYFHQIITETTMVQSGEVERILNRLKETGKVSLQSEGKNAGCIVIKGLSDSNGNPLGDKVLVRQDGTAVYAGKDIILHLWKFGLESVKIYFEPLFKQKNNEEVWISIADLNKGKLIEERAEFHINVVDQRQSYPLEVVKQSLKTLGYINESNNFKHLAYETVVLSKETAISLGYGDKVEVDTKYVAMSGRKGLEVSVDELLDKMTQIVLEQSQKKETNLGYDEALKIAAGSLRYHMIKYGYNTIIVFDIDEALKADGDTGIYLMYAYVRARSILQKAGDFPSRFDLENVDLETEIVDLVTHLGFYQEVLEKVSTSLELSKLTEYVSELARKFTSLYQKVNIINEPNESKKFLLLNIVKSFERVFGDLIDALGLYRADKI